MFLDSEVQIYLTCLTVGSAMGLIRFLKSNRRLSWRTGVSYTFFGGFLGATTVGFLYGGEVEGRRWLVLATASAVGFLQPEGNTLLKALLSAAGLKIGEDGGTNK